MIDSIAINCEENLLLVSLSFIYQFVYLFSALLQICSLGLFFKACDSFSCFRPVVDPQLQDLISRLLAKDPKQRIKMQDIKVNLSHFFSKVLFRRKIAWAGLIRILHGAIHAIFLSYSFFLSPSYSTVFECFWNQCRTICKNCLYNG